MIGVTSMQFIQVFLHMKIAALIGMLPSDGHVGLFPVSSTLAA